LTGTLQVLTLYGEIDPQVPLSRLKASHRLCADGTFIGRDRIFIGAISCGGEGDYIAPFSATLLFSVTRL
jgi:hypothetical protein